MEYNDFKDKVGIRFDIVEGDLVESPSGLFIVSESYQEDSIYLNKLTKQVLLIPSKNHYIGRMYRLRLSDCTSLWTMWLDANKGTDYYHIYKTISHRDFMNWMRMGMCHYFEDQKFEKVSVDSLEEGDCLVYSFNDLIDSHVGIYIANDKILHHLPKKFSSLDQLDRTKIIGAYRYANKQT
jgi:hypothetical protein